MTVRLDPRRASCATTDPNGDYGTTTQPRPGIPNAYRTSRCDWLWEPLTRLVCL